MTGENHKIIYLITDDADNCWCQDPAPGAYHEPEMSIPYIRADLLIGLDAKGLARLIAELRPFGHISVDDKEGV